MNKNNTIQIEIDHEIRLSGTNLPDEVQARLRDILIFQNPQWLDNEKRGFWNGNTQRYLHFLTEDTQGTLTLPRGFIHYLAGILKENGLTYTLIDKTRLVQEVNFQFQGELYDFQQQATQAILDRRFGVINCPTGGGKTIIALYCIAKRSQPALVIVHTKELLYQWQARAEEFLGLDRDDIGLIGDGHNRIGEKLTIAIVNSLYKCAKDIYQRIGFLIVDECHHTPARTFIEAASVFDSRYMLGLSATPYRRDDLTQVIHFFIGNLLYTISPKELQRQDKLMKAQVIVRQTSFDYDYRQSEDYQAMLTSLAEDIPRNTLIVNDVCQHVHVSKGIALVISDRKEHCNQLAHMLEQKQVSVRVLTGSVPKSKRQKIIEELNNGSIQVLVATSQLVGEGFDLKQLSALFLSTPVKFSGRIKQYVGRILRIDKEKEDATIYDYVDKAGVLRASFNWRIKAYQELGFKIQ